MREFMQKLKRIISVVSRQFDFLPASEGAVEEEIDEFGADLRGLSKDELKDIKESLEEMR